MKVVIPAAGLGRRFEPLSRVVPKELLLLGDRPLLHHALDEAAEAGLDAAVIVTAAWKRPLFERYFEVAEPPLPTTIVEQRAARGIGDAVLVAAAAAGDRFGVLLPDDVVRERGQWTELQRDSDPALCVRTVSWNDVSRFGIAEVAGGRCISLVEKPRAADARSNLAVFGRYQATPEVLHALEALGGVHRGEETPELQLTDGFAACRPRAVVFRGEIFDCGTPSSYQESCAGWRR